MSSVGMKRRNARAQRMKYLVVIARLLGASANFAEVFSRRKATAESIRAVEKYIKTLGG
jgi:hypothetical protein